MQAYPDSQGKPIFARAAHNQPVTANSDGGPAIIEGLGVVPVNKLGSYAPAPPDQIARNEDLLTREIMSLFVRSSLSGGSA